MKRAVVIGSVAAVVLAAVAAAGIGIGLPRIGQAILARHVDAFRATLGPRAQFTYAHAEPHLLARSASFEGVTLTLADGTTLTARRLDVTPDGPHRLKHLHARDLTLSGFPTDPLAMIVIGQLDGRDLDDAAAPLALPADGAGTSGPQILSDDARGALIRAAETLRHIAARTLSLDDVRLTAKSAATPPFGTITSLRVDDYGPGRSTALDIRTVAVPDFSYRLTGHSGATGMTSEVNRHAGITLDSLGGHRLRLADLMAFVAAGRDDGPLRLDQPSDLAAEGLRVAIRSDEGPEGTFGIGHAFYAEHATAPLIRAELSLTAITLPARRLAVLMPNRFHDGQLQGRLAAQLEGNTQTGEWHIRRLQLGFDHLGTARLGLDGQWGAAGFTFSRAALGLADGGLRAAMLTQDAAIADQPPDVFAASLAQRVRDTLATFGPAAASLAPAIADFIEAGGALELTAQPAHPMRPSALLNPASQDALIGALAALNPHATRTASLPP